MRPPFSVTLLAECVRALAKGLEDKSAMVDLIRALTQRARMVLTMSLCLDSLKEMKSRRRESRRQSFVLFK